VNERPGEAGPFYSLEVGLGGRGGLTQADRTIGPPEGRPAGVPVVPARPGDFEAALLGGVGSEFCGPNAAGTPWERNCLSKNLSVRCGGEWIFRSVVGGANAVGTTSVAGSNPVDLIQRGRSSVVEQ